MPPDVVAAPVRRVAVVGTGAVAPAHAAAVAAHPDRARLVAVTDVDGTRAARFAQDWQIPHVAGSLTEILTARPDLVLLCTPPDQHRPAILECLGAGVNVLVEKPPALSLAQLDEIARAQAGSPAWVATVFQHRFGRGAVRLRELTRAGELGRPLVATCTTHWYRDEEYYRHPGRGTWLGEGGGPTMMLGIHQLDLLLSVLGDWTEVDAMAARQARPIETEDVSLALVRFTNGALATVVTSAVSARQESAVRVDYERATVELAHLYGYSDDDWTVTPGPDQDGVSALWQEGGPGRPSGHEAQFVAVLDALDQGHPPPVTLPEARRTLELVAAIYRSAFTDTRVRRGEITVATPFSLRMDGTGAPWAGSR